jgi:hypothetical protein
VRIMLLGVFLIFLALLGTDGTTMDEQPTTSSSTRADKLAIHNTRGAGARYFQQKKTRYQKDTQTTTPAQSSSPPSAFYVSTHRLISVALAAATTILGIKPRGRLFPRKRHDRAAARGMSGDSVG